MMGITEKIEALREVTVDTEQFGRVLDKLLEAALSQQRLQMARYDLICVSLNATMVWILIPFIKNFNPESLAMTWIILSGLASMNSVT